MSCCDLTSINEAFAKLSISDHPFQLSSNPRIDNLEQTLSSVHEKITSISKKLHDIAPYIYGNTPPLESISSEFIKWREKVKEIKTQHTEAGEQLSILEKKLPYEKNIHILNRIYQVWKKAAQKQLLAEEKICFLEHLLAPKVEESLRFCKEKIQKVEAEQNIEKFKEDVKELKLKIERDRAQAKSKTTPHPTIVAQVDAINNEVVQFFLFFIKDKTQNSITDQLRVELQELAKPRRKLEKKDFLPESHAACFMRRFPGVELDKEYKFRQPNWLMAIYNSTYYKDIAPNVKALEEIAQGLYFMAKELQKRLVLVTDSDTPQNGLTSLAEEYTMYKEVLDHLECELRSERDKLYSISFNKKVHAGLYYIAELRIFLEEVRNLIRHFHELVHDGGITEVLTSNAEKMFSLESQQLTLCEKIIECCSYSQELPSIESLRSYSHVSDFQKRWHLLFVTALASQATKLITYTSEDHHTKQRILFLDIYLVKDRKLSDEVATYIQKGLVQYLYQTGKRDTEFELALYVLRNKKCFKDAWTALIATKPKLRELTDKYLNKTEFHREETQFQQAARLYSACAVLQDPHQNDPTKRIIHAIFYAKARKTLEIIQRCQAASIRSLADEKRDFLRRYAESNNYPDYCKTLSRDGQGTSKPEYAQLYAHLTDALFSINQTEKDIASRKAREIMKSCISYEDDNATVMPLHTMILEHAVLTVLKDYSDSQLVPSEFNFFTSNLKLYLQNNPSAIQRALDHLHGQDQMELCLYCINDFTFSSSKTSRNGSVHFVWEKILDKYKLYLSEADKERYKKEANTIYNENIAHIHKNERLRIILDHIIRKMNQPMSGEAR